MLTKFYRINDWKKNPKNRVSLDGLTLVELVVAVALVTTLSAVIFTGMSYFLDVKVEVVQTADIQAKSENSFSQIRKEIRNAEALEVRNAVDSSDTHCLLVKQISGVRRSGLKFTGVSGSKSLLINGFRGPTGNASRTAALWIHADKLSSNPLRTVLLGWGKNGNSYGRDFVLYVERETIDGQPKIKFGVSIYGTKVQSNLALNEGEWQHLAVTFDSSDSSVFGPNTVSLYVNGNRDLNPTFTNSHSVNTGGDMDVRIGGPASNEFGSVSAFRGAIANVRIWDNALNASQIRREMELPNAGLSDNSLEIDFAFNGDLMDGSPNSRTLNTSNNFFSNPNYQTAEYPEFVDDELFTEKIFAFTPDSNSNHYLLFERSRFSGGVNNCVDPSTSNVAGDVAAQGWSEVGLGGNWARTNVAPDNIFELMDRPGGQTLEVHAEAAASLGKRDVQFDGANSLLASKAVIDPDLCTVAPNIVGFDTGGFGISQVVVTIATDDFEQGWDELAFLNSSARTETTETISGQTTKIWIYNDIADPISVDRGETSIWPKLTGKFYPDLGYMKLYTRTQVNNVSSPVDQSVLKQLTDWERVFRQITYKTTAPAYLPTKDFIFSLGPNIPCRLTNNYIACRNAKDNDGDGDPTTCYHWFNFVRYSDLAADDSSWSCWSRSGDNNNNQRDCKSDWENARQHAGSDAMNLFGLRGYLATVVTQEEQVCANDKINGSMGWLGATDRQCERNNSCGSATSWGTYCGSNASYGRGASCKETDGEGRWYWVTGPEGEWTLSDDGAGYQDHGGNINSNIRKGTYLGRHRKSGNDWLGEVAQRTVTLDGEARTLPAQIDNWASKEPNNCCAFKEDYLHTWPNGTWNDYTSFWKVDGYVIEYGGLKDDDTRTLIKTSTIDTLEFLKACRTEID